MSNKIESYKIKNWTVLGRTFFKPPFKVSDALINEARIVHVVKGCSKLFSANKSISLSSNDTLVMKADNFVNNWVENKNNETNEVIVIQLTSDFLQFIYGNQFPEWFVAVQSSATNSVEKAEPNLILTSYFENIRIYLDNPKLLTQDIIKIKVKELISILVQTDQSNIFKSLFEHLFNPVEYDFQKVVSENTYKDLNIEDLAFLTGLSLSSFKRKFKKIYGTSPNKYIISKRLEKAQTLLNTSDLRISEIAYDCGFSDIAYFSKLFRTYYNTSPSDYRKNSLD